MNAAFVLSGGGSLGAVQVGMLRALYERGVEPDVVIGTSVGALNGAYIASRPATVETADRLGEVWLSIRRRSGIFPLNPLTGFFGFIGQREYLISDQSLRRLIRTHTEFRRLEDAPTPFHVIATDLFSGRELRLSRGDAVDAVMASAALPGIFPPVDWDGTELIDGGVSNNTPITHAIELGAERIYVLPTGNACALEKAPGGALAMLLHAMSLLVSRRLILEIEHLKDETDLVVLPPPCPMSVQPADFGHSDELIESGYEGSAAFLERYGDEEKPPIPRSMSMHDHRGEGIAVRA